MQSRSNGGSFEMGSMMQELEGRRMLSVTLDSATGLLSVVGTNQSDTINVALRQASENPVGDLTLDVSVNGVVTSERLANVTGLNISGGDGKDIITLAADLDIPATLLGGNGKDILTGGAAADSLDGGNGKDILVGGEGDDILVGGHGKDSLDGVLESNKGKKDKGPKHDDDTDEDDDVTGGEDDDLLGKGHGKGKAKGHDKGRGKHGR